MSEATETLNPCPQCGGRAAIQISTGGPCIYWRVECADCGFNTRGPGVLHGLAPLGFGVSQNAPQNSREEALERWSALSQAQPQPSDEVARSMTGNVLNADIQEK
jgi:hypothetical protein